MEKAPEDAKPETKSGTDWKAALIGSAAGALGTTIVGLVFSSATMNFISKMFSRDTLPKGAIIFVAGSECGAMGDGWKKFDLAAGRFLVGAGSNSDYPNKRFEPNITSKGNAEIRLTEMNLPPIAAEIPYYQFGIVIDGRGTLPVAHSIAGGGPFQDASRVSGRIAFGGRAEPIDILPPSIALTACDRS